MATFQITANLQRVEIGHMVAARLATDEPGGSARFYNTSTAGRLFLYEADSEPGPEVAGIPVLPGSYWPEYWIPDPGPTQGLWCWSNTADLSVTVVLIRA